MNNFFKQSDFVVIFCGFKRFVYSVFATSTKSTNFCNTNIITDLDEVRSIFDVGLKEIRLWEQQCADDEVDFIENRKEIVSAVNKIIKGLE